MSHGPVILTLSSWAQQHLREMLTAKSKTAFNDAFEAFVAPHANITVNGMHMSRDKYMQMLWNDEAGERSGTVDFKGTVAVSKERDVLIQTGEVGVFFEATIHRAGLTSNSIITSSMNLVVEEAKKGAEEPPEFDGRQATSINQVLTDVQKAITRND